MLELNSTIRGFSLCLRQLVATFAVSVMVASPNVVAGEGPDQQKEDVAGLLRVMLDESRPYADRWNALQGAQEFPNEVLTPLLLDVIRHADDRFAMAGAYSAIRRGICTGEIVGTIRARLANWTLPTGPGIVQGIVHEDPIHGDCAQPVLAIVRDVLRLLGMQEPPSGPQMRESKVIEVNWAGIVLLFDHDPVDGQLLKASLRAYPEAYVAWLALNRLNALDDEMINLARRVYSDTTYDSVVRVGAALAAQEQDDEASEFALSVIRDYLREFGERSVQDLFPNADIYTSDRETKRALFRMQEEMTLIAFLRFRKGEQSKELALNYLNSPNEAVREMVLWVTAREWPEEVQARLSRIPEEDQVKALATIHYLHPELNLRAAASKLTQDAWESVKRQVQQELSRPRTVALHLALD